MRCAHPGGFEDDLAAVELELDAPPADLALVGVTEAVEEEGEGAGRENDLLGSDTVRREGYASPTRSKGVPAPARACVLPSMALAIRLAILGLTDHLGSGEA